MSSPCGRGIGGVDDIDVVGWAGMMFLGGMMMVIGYAMYQGIICARWRVGGMWSTDASEVSLFVNLYMHTPAIETGSLAAGVEPMVAYGLPLMAFFN